MRKLSKTMHHHTNSSVDQMTRESIIIVTIIINKRIHHHHHHPILIRVYPHKQGWPDLLSSNSNLSNSHSSSRSIQGILLLLINTLALFLHLHLPRLIWSSSLQSSCPSLQTPMLFSKHAHHPSSTHTCTISLHSPLPSEPLFPSTLFPFLHTVNFKIVNLI